MIKKVLLYFLISILPFVFLGCGIMDMTQPVADEFGVQIIGDSVFDLDGYIHDHLQDLSGKSYNDNSSSGDTVSYIRQQYRDAIGNYPNINTIIMDGGANDILMDVYWNLACRTSSSTAPSGCRNYIDSLVEDLESLWEEIDSDGVDDIVHMGYYELKWGYLAGNGSRLDAAVNYADDEMEAACSVSPAACWFVDTRADFRGNEGSYILSDGLHPTSAGGEVCAQLIWDKLVSVGAYR